jgi:hypothetical protein
MICVGELIVKEVAGTPPKATAVTPVKLAPLIVTVTPLPAWPGEKEVIIGPKSTKPFKFVCPPAEDTATAPLAPWPTVASIDVGDKTVKEVAGTPPKLTDLAPVKLVPVIVILSPSAAVCGENEVINGAGIHTKPGNVTAPEGVVTTILPEAPLPTVTPICEGE